MDTVWQVFSFLFLFGLVVGLAYATTRWLGGRLGGAGAPGRLMRVVEVLAVGRDRQLLLVEVAGRFLLIGAGARGFTLLAELDHPSEVARIAAVAAPGPPVGLPAAVEPFRQVLARLLPRGAGAPSAGDKSSDPPVGDRGSNPTAVDRGSQARERLSASLERLRRLGNQQDGGSGQP